MPIKTVLSLGAGVQSTVLYLWAIEGRIAIDAAVFADTQDEPEAVYSHLEWLKGLNGPPIHHVGLKESLGSNVMAGLNSTGQEFVSIPAFTMRENGKQGMQRRQCTAEFKLRVIERSIRRDVLGLQPRKHTPRNTSIVQLIGFSSDEPGRVKRNLEMPRPRRWSARFPLHEEDWSRRDCEEWLAPRVPHKVVRSACVFCPYRASREWRDLRDTDPNGWAKAVEVDTALRNEASVCTRGMITAMYLHPSRMPLEQAVDDRETMPLFFQDCIGGCGC